MKNPHSLESARPGRARPALMIALALVSATAVAFAQEPKAGKKAGKRGAGGGDAAAVKADMAGPQALARMKVPDGVKLLPDLAYRDGNPMWKLDLAMPAAPSDKPRAAIVFMQHATITHPALDAFFARTLKP